MEGNNENCNYDNNETNNDVYKCETSSPNDDKEGNYETLWETESGKDDCEYMDSVFNSYE